MTKTDCILLYVNMEAFDILIKEKLKKGREERGKFVHSSIPRLREFFGLQNVCSNVHLLFKDSSWIKDQWVLSEGEYSHKLHLIRQGKVGLYKNV
mmetsp:Transcript_43285/g.41675  ORF Transcript_43285/g.41675 Transcript_43285/m.41675 type:complete len:95 (+) Transcript_43285:926-1210(+)